MGTISHNNFNIILKPRIYYTYYIIVIQINNITMASNVRHAKSVTDLDIPQPIPLCRPENHHFLDESLRPKELRFI